MRTRIYLNRDMECWLITSRAEVMRLEFGEEPPAEICLPDKPLLEIEDNAVQKAIQDAPYITYKRFHLAHDRRNQRFVRLARGQNEADRGR